jgi:hypothetical protein
MSQLVALDVLPSDTWLTIFEFLWYPEVLNCAQVCHSFDALLRGLKSTILQKYLRNLLVKLQSPFQRLAKTATFDVEAIVRSDLLTFANRMREWPSTMIANRAAKVHEVHVEGQRSKCFSYRGPSLGGNCAIVANYPFPVIPEDYRDDPSPLIPFSKVINDDDSGRLKLTASRVAYYEVKIHDPMSVESSSGASAARATVEGDDPPCIVVGLGCALFPLQHKMPGWDAFSFGFHSDDGLYFHDYEDQVRFCYQYMYS